MTTVNQRKHPPDLNPQRATILLVSNAYNLVFHQRTKDKFFHHRSGLFPGSVCGLYPATGENTYLATISKYDLCLPSSIRMTIYTCPACGRDSNSHYFYQRHVGEKVILIIDPNGKLLHVVRNSCFGETQDFECIWKGCYYRDCDSEVIKDHINSACSHRGTLKNEFY